MPTLTIPTLTPIASTNLCSYGYDPVSKTFAVQFAAGGDKVYLYRGVPADVVAAFEEAESKGAFFARSIRTQYVHSVVDPVQDRAAEAADAQPSA